MSDKTDTKAKDAATSTGEPTNNSNTMLAGVSPEAEKQAKADSKEVKDEEVAIPAVDTDTLIKKLPENGAVLPGAEIAVVNTVATEAPSAAGGVFGDEFAGQGGTFIVGEDGIRRRVHEKVTDQDGKELGFRPIP